jgi:hypothetical protein
MLRGPDFFGFAGIPPIEVPALPLELHVAEKLHAYSRDYGGRQSSRVKDLVDLVLIPSTAAFNAGRLRQAIDRTIVSRNTPRVPQFVPRPPETWATAYRKLASEIGLNPDVAIGHVEAAAFLDPILTVAAAAAARWDPAGHMWKHPGDALQPP